MAETGGFALAKSDRKAGKGTSWTSSRVDSGYAEAPRLPDKRAKAIITYFGKEERFIELLAEARIRMRAVLVGRAEKALRIQEEAGESV